MEMELHGIGLTYEEGFNCTRYILPVDEQIQGIKIGYDRKLWRFTYLQVSSQQQVFFTVGERNKDTKMFEFNIENPIIGFKSVLLRNKDTGE